MQKVTQLVMPWALLWGTQWAMPWAQPRAMQWAILKVPQ
jgi:hypothetical protein